MSDAQPVRTEVDGHVLVITLDRPHVRNAMDRATAEGVEAALDRLDDDPELWVGVITGAGGSFCARHGPQRPGRGASTRSPSAAAPSGCSTSHRPSR